MAKTLLLADDSVTIQKVVGISLASEDIRLVTVDNGDDAVARARELRPDAILADCVMPGRSGYEVCEAIAADPTLRHIPVLLLTGTFEAFDEERAARCGAAGHIAKPFEAQTLLDEVQRLFVLASTRRPAPAAAAPARPVAEAPQRTAAPTAAPRPAASPPPAPKAVTPAAARAAESFDFFEEEIDDLLPAELAEDTGFAAGHDVDLDSSETPFAFGDAEAALPRPAPAERTVVMPQRPQIPQMPQATAQRAPAERRPLVGGPAAEASAAARMAAERKWAPMQVPELPEEPAPPMEDDLEEVAATIGEDDLTRLDATPSRPSRALSPERTLVPHALEDFDLDASADEPALVRVDASDLAGATVLDPDGAGGFDVSASDLGGPFALDEPIEAPRAMAGDTNPSTRPAPPAAPSIDPSALELLEPEPEPPPQPDFPEDREFVVHEAEPAGDTEAEVSALAQSALDGLAPRLRAQLHDTLEKVAWESLSDVTDQIVRQAVERVEAIAWEVIPQMAETMIREEIRRMKGEDGS